MPARSNAFARIAALAFFAASLAACASGPQRGAGAGGGPRIDVASQAERILADARRKKSDKDCMAAIASYRVVASLGKGHDTAQYELGACLLEANADTTMATALLRDEGLFWLRRAAYAGNARAQLALAGALSGAPSGAPADAGGHNSAGLRPDLVEGFGWSLIYADNAAHKLYGLPDLQPAAAEHFKTQMTDAMISDANAFAAAFQKIEMAVFTPPGASALGAGRPQGQNPGGDRQRRRR